MQNTPPNRYFCTLKRRRCPSGGTNPWVVYPRALFARTEELVYIVLPPTGSQELDLGWKNVDGKWEKVGGGVKVRVEVSETNVTVINKALTNESTSTNKSKSRELVPHKQLDTSTSSVVVAIKPSSEVNIEGYVITKRAVDAINARLLEDANLSKKYASERLSYYEKNSDDASLKSISAEEKTLEKIDADLRLINDAKKLPTNSVGKTFDVFFKERETFYTKKLEISDAEKEVQTIQEKLDEIENKVADLAYADNISVNDYVKNNNIPMLSLSKS